MPTVWTASGTRPIAHWLATVTGVAAKFFPETEIRSFGEDEVEAALAWAGAVDPQPPPDAAA